MADDERLHDLLKTVRDLTEKIGSTSSRLSSSQQSVNEEVSTVFKRNNTASFHPSRNSVGGSSPTRSRFRRLINMRQIGNNISTTKRKIRTQNNVPFMCDLILLAGPHMKIVPKQGTKLALFEKGHVLSACQFNKCMSEVQVEATILEAFGETIPPDVSIEIMMSAHNKLVKPSLAPGQEGINGVILHRLFRSKPVYVLPNKQLIKTEIKETPLCEKDEDEKTTMPLPQGSSRNFSSSGRVICEKCSCTYLFGDVCIRCAQDVEYQESLLADKDPKQSEGKWEDSMKEGSSVSSEVVDEPSENEPLDLAQLRNNRLAHLTDQQILDDQHQYYPPPEMPQQHPVKIHRTTIRQDLIKEFADPSILDKMIEFKLINERGDIEAGEGLGVSREVYTLFWNEFAISMTIGERERVPFVRHYYFIEEWKAIGRILVKGFTSVDYFPTFLSKAFVCFCLFGTEVTQDIFLSSFKRYLSQIEEDLIESVLKSSELPEDMEEFSEFLERFQCRSVVKKENVSKILLEIAKQELVQKPHLMIAAWKPIMQERLKNLHQFQSIPAVMEMYGEFNPTPKKVLHNLSCNPQTDAEKDTLKFLQRFIRGLDTEKLVKFLKFTTGMDVIGREKLQVSFLSSQGFSSRPIAHTCAPLLELPTTYNNFVELREEFENILNQKISWDIDIV